MTNWGWGPHPGAPETPSFKACTLGGAGLGRKILSFALSFIHSMNDPLLSPYHGPGVVLALWVQQKNKADTFFILLLELMERPGEAL